MASYLQRQIRFLAVTSCFLAVYANSQAQFGVQISRFIPKGDIGQYFNKGTSIDVFCPVQSNDGKWDYCFGFLYTTLSPRLDTVPIYAVRDGGGLPTLVMPGFLVNKNFSIKCFSGGFNRRVFHIHDLGFYAGLGIIAGLSHVNYVKEITTVKTETADIDTKIVGLKISAKFQYRINNHFDVFADASRSIASSGNEGISYTHNKFGIGANYFIFVRDRE